MSRRLIKVECYAGAHADETPRRVTVDGRKHTVARLLKESIEESPRAREQTHRYTIQTIDGMIFEILRSSDGNWYLDL
jgi:hypothetical protein